MFRIIDQKTITIYPHKYKSIRSAEKDIQSEDPEYQKNLTIINEKFITLLSNDNQRA